MKAKSMKKPVRFIGYDCDVVVLEYKSNQQKAIQLVIADTDYNRNRTDEIGGPMATATTCIPGYPFASNETAIKDYSENAGILDVLIEAGFVQKTGKTVRSGFADLPVVRINTIH